MPRFKMFCLAIIVAALSSPTYAEIMSEADLASAIQFVDQTDQNELCDWSQPNDPIYREMNLTY